MGNIGSLVNMFRRIETDILVTSDFKEIASAKKILLPGVGAFDAAMNRIDGLNLRDLLREKALVEKVPFLGICLGMQLLVNQSEEGTARGLGLISGNSIRFPKHINYKVPHMGWNTTTVFRKNSLTKNSAKVSRYYFVHSYYVKLTDPHHEILRANHGLDFAAGIGTDNIFGLQFHPEKSHRFGMTILKTFSDL